jgi:hypothetical protein
MHPLLYRGVVQQLTVCQSRGMAYVFPRSQSNVLFTRMFSVTYLCRVMVFLVYLFYTDSCVIFCVGPRVSVFLWMRLSVRGEFPLHNSPRTDKRIHKNTATNCTNY